MGCFYNPDGGRRGRLRGCVNVDSMIGWFGTQGPKTLQQTSEQTALLAATRLSGLSRLDWRVGQVLFHIFGVEVLSHIAKVAGPQHIIHDFSGRDGVAIEDIIDA